MLIYVGTQNDCFIAAMICHKPQYMQTASDGLHFVAIYGSVPCTYIYNQ